MGNHMENLRSRAEKLIKERKFLEQEEEKLGGERAINALEIYSKIKDLIFELRYLEGRAPEMDNADIATRFKFSRKGRKAGKGFWHLVGEINGLHQKGELSESDAKQFGVVLEKVKAKKHEEAERELGRFKKLELLWINLEKLDDELWEVEKEIDSRINVLKRSLSDAQEEIPAENLEAKAEKYKEAKRILEEYAAWRERQTAKLKGMPARSLIRSCSASEDLFLLGFPRPKDEFSFDDFGAFLKDAKIDADAKGVLSLADQRVEELKKHLSDHHMYKRLVSENLEWLEAVTSLERTDFLSFDFGNNEKNERIIAAIGVSRESSLEKKMNGLSKIPRADFERSKTANSHLEKLKLSPKKSEPINAEKIAHEISELRKIKSDLPIGEH